MCVSRRFLALLISLAVAIAALGDTGKVNGSITANGKTTTLKYAVATQKEDPFDKKKKATFLLVTDQEVPPKAVADEFEFMRWYDKANLHGFSALITDDKQVVSGQIYDPGLKHNGFSSTGTQKLELTSMSATRIAGKISIPPGEFFGDKYQYSASFDVPVGAPAAAPSVATAAPKGTPLPAGGGEPAKAYLAFDKAVAAGDMAAVKRGVSAEQRKSMDDPDFKKMFPLMQAMRAKGIKITSGAVNGDTATLLATGKDEGGVSNGTITMVKEGGAWKVQREEWKSGSSH
jgi:hypothetical protein